ncbi:MAG: methionine aminopeptidase [Candidatus Peribacteria bacterium]|nr:methionine aminopeptidase [Candidatus Peribacteria bacterium]
MPSFQIFTPAEIESLRKGGKILHDCLQETARHVRPGISTGELDLIAEAYIRSHGASPAFKGYRGFPGSLCISVNDECVHGIPGPRLLKDGDIVSLDGGVVFDGLITDACITVGVGTISPATQKFLNSTKQALDEACRMMKPGIRVGDISHTVQTVVEKAGYHCLRALTGHGLGNTLHQFPDVPNVGKAGTGPVVPVGTILAIEPITSMGTRDIREADDHWTLLSDDGSLTAHFEHTVLFVKNGYEILT